MFDNITFGDIATKGSLSVLGFCVGYVTHKLLIDKHWKTPRYMGYNGMADCVSPSKMYFIMNMSLKMSAGKMCAQSCHGCMSLLMDEMQDAQEMHSFISKGQPKVVLRADDEVELNDLVTLCVYKGIPHALIRDAGRTEVPAGSVTCLAIGPMTLDQADGVTSKLQLL